MARSAYVGTSGWQYDHWKEGWYKGVKRADWLRHTAGILTALEADGTFYRQQKAESYRKWADQTPEEFKFAVRGHRYVTHSKRLKDVDDALKRVREQAEGLGAKLGAMLWQLPPNFDKDLDRLESFLALLDRWETLRHGIEFRHDSWFAEDVAELLARHRVANVISHSGRWEMWDAVTTDFVYVRLHGAPDTYASDYDDAALDKWADRVKAWLKEDRTVYVFFDNDAKGHAPYNAEDLLDRVV